MINQERESGTTLRSSLYCRERLAQALDGNEPPRRHSGFERRASFLKPPDERERSVEVLSGEDRVVDLLDANTS